jgi:hypothetical protein
MNDSSHQRLAGPHPLAVALTERLAPLPGARVLEIAAGSGRNTAALETAGFAVTSLDDARPSSCAAALATHALLHGTAAELATLLGRVAVALEPAAPLYATFGSTRDARYGEGTRIEAHVYAPAGGDEDGVPHPFFDRDRLTALLQRWFVIESLDETGVDEIAGRWAHEKRPLKAAVHWFAVVRRSGQ